MGRFIYLGKFRPDKWLYPTNLTLKYSGMPFQRIRGSQLFQAEYPWNFEDLSANLDVSFRLFLSLTVLGFGTQCRSDFQSI